MKKNLNTKQCKTKLKQIKTLLSKEDKNLTMHLKANFFKYYQITSSKPRILTSLAFIICLKYTRIN